MNIRYEWIEDIEKFKEIAGKWDKALADSGSYNPFLLSDFILTWWKYFGEEKKLAILAVFDDGKIAAGLPLYIRHGGFKEGFARILGYIGGSAASYTEPLITSGFSFLPVLEDALSASEDWDILLLPDIRQENGFLPECLAGVKKKYTIKAEQNTFNWAIDLSRGKEAYLSTVSKKLRRDLKSKRRLVEKELGKIELREIEGEDGANRLFDIYTSFSVKAFEARKRKSTFESGRYSSFYRDFLSCMARSRRLDAHALYAGGNILAVSFAYKFGKGFNWTLTGFNYDYKYFRPGYLLIEELIDYAILRGEVYFNWYGYERFYKEQWCDLKTPLLRITVSKGSLKASSFLFLKGLKGFLGKARLCLNKGNR